MVGFPVKYITHHKAAIALVLLLIVATGALSVEPVRESLLWAWCRLRGRHTLSDRLEQYGAAVGGRVWPDFERVGLEYPPYDLAYVAFKDTRVLEVYARMSPTDPWRFIREYPILAASGKEGPKLAEGDNQVPEGVYSVEYLNPNSLFHLSIRLDYPNDFDRRMARTDGRGRLGSDIMIHGSSVSIGCLAIGDEAIEDLFVMAGLVSKKRVRVVISPTDFRVNPQVVPIERPAWVGRLYADLRAELEQFPRKSNLSTTRTDASALLSPLNN